jgi:hypothetical protein
MAGSFNFALIFQPLTSNFQISLSNTDNDHHLKNTCLPFLNPKFDISNSPPKTVFFVTLLDQ